MPTRSTKRSRLSAAAPLLATLSLFHCLAAASENATPAAATSRRPNILLAIADDWGFPDAGAYGNGVVKTPTFDRLAREGVLFTHAFVSSPSCTPSRGALLTGQHFWRLGHGANLWSTLPADLPTYTDLLEAAGYHVGFTRKGWGPGKLGERTRNPAGDQFKDFAEFLRRRPNGKPFCFWFGSVDPHRPYDLGSGEHSGIDLAKIDVPGALPDVPQVRSDVADYYFEVQRFDREVGDLLRQLEAIGELENTIIVMTGDHGMPFPRGKGNLYDLGTRVPLAVLWPAGGGTPGRTIDDFVSLTDLAPTFLAAAGLDAPPAMTGHSLLPLLASDKSGMVDRSRDHVVFGRERHTPAQEAPNSGGYPMRGLRTRDWLYIRNSAPDRWPAGTPDYRRAFMTDAWLGDCDNGPSKEYLWQARNIPEVAPFYARAFGKRLAEELYDLRGDAEQLENVAADPRHSEVRASLAAQLTDELKAGEDPRVLGGGDAFDQYPYYGSVPIWPWK
jgi:N-sulfoglucosamine sulfohydrolase